MSLRWQHCGQVDFVQTASSALRSLFGVVDNNLEFGCVISTQSGVFATLNSAHTTFAVQVEYNRLHEIMSRMQVIRTDSQEKK